MIGGEIVTSVSSSSAAVRMEALTSSAYTNSYGNIHISGTLVETYKAASIANPGAVTSPHRQEECPRAAGGALTR
ncbi:hypothetical protein GGD66_006600 [Bradyrhizobium sp. CIR48]|nr:hypothetical protein [Bradyrhizobium sp. CIR48]